MFDLSQNKIVRQLLAGLFCALIILPSVVPLTLANAQEVPIMGPEEQSAKEEAGTYEKEVADAQKAQVEPRGTVSAFTTMGLWIGNFILNIGAMFAWMGGKILEYSIQEFILELGDTMRNGIGTSIEVVWTLIRDMANLIFIFGFIYIGIVTIINADSSSAKRMLASIIIGALLINFSLYFTKIVIDISNYLSVEIYKALLADSSSVSISSKFADVLGIVDIFGRPADPATFAALTGTGNVAFFLMGTLFLIVTGFVLAAGGILIIIRFVALVFIMVFSPMLFAASVFPQTAGMASDLWKKLINYSFFAPAYLILLVVSLKILEGFMRSMGVSGVGFQDVLIGKQGAFGVITVFIAAIIFMVMSLKISTQFGIYGGDKAVSTFNSLKSKGQSLMLGAVGGATAGLAAAGLRQTVGKRAHKWSDSGKLKDFAANRSGIAGWGARKVLKGTTAVADSSLDVRKIGGFGKDIGIGEGRKGGYKSAMEEVEKAEAKFAKEYLGEVDDDDVRVTARKKQMETAQRELKLNRNRLQRIISDKGVDKDSEVYKNAVRDLEALEKAEKETEAAYKKEKQRRIIGSTFGGDPEAVKDEKGRVDSVEAEIKKAWGSYLKPKDANGNDIPEKDIETFRKERMAEIEKLNEKLEDAKQKYDAVLTAQPDRGYAGVLEKSNLWTSWPGGRSVESEREAGKALRKSIEKKAKKSKDDARHEELVEASKKKD